MSEGLNVIALISGGKDSLYSILHCLQNGHRVVALANLYPPSIRVSSTPVQHLSHDINDSTTRCQSDLLETRPAKHEKESPDLHSFMYQTVGHTIIPLYSTALQLPLYRRQITGTSIQQSQHYDTSSSPLLDDSSASPSDETEDLIPLLRQVMSAHPQANAVSTGAILSTYQRTRVETIALQLGLTPLSYLWQYPLLPPPLLNPTSSTQQSRSSRPDSLTGLLEDIGSSALEARIIKIASAGISDRMLFANVADLQTQSRLLDGLSPFFEEDDEIGLRGAVLGEGGEYETIALNGPTQVWKGGRIDIDCHHNRSYTEDGVYYLKFGQASIVPHDPLLSSEDESNIATTDLVRVPSLLDPQFVQVQNDLDESNFGSRFGHVVTNDASMLGENKDQSQHNCFRIPLSLTVSSNTVTISNITSSSLGAILASNRDTALVAKSLDIISAQATASTQFENILDHLPTLFNHIADAFKIPNLSTRNISSTALLLNSMTDFTSVNPIYARIWPKGLPNPPARVTVAAPLPPDVYVSLSLTMDLCPKEVRRGLHVQGWSYWAPANIGPYSQAIAVPLQTPTPVHDNARNEYETNYMPAGKRLEIVHIAGQIPLVPSSMQVHTGSFLDAAILSAQHLWRVGQERGVDIWPYSAAYLAKSDKSGSVIKANAAFAVWRQAHLRPTWTVPQDDDDDDGDQTHSDSNGDDDASFDVWNLQHNRSQQHGFRKSQISFGKHRHVLPNHSCFNSTNSPRQRYIPPFMAVEVNALPRNVDIEWWSNGIAGLAKPSYSNSQISWQHKRMSYGHLSCLTILPEPMSERSTKFISYQISSFSSESNPFSVGLSTILQLLEEEDSNSVPLDAQLVQGTAFVTTAALGSTEWSTLMSNESDFDLPRMRSTTAQASSSRSLGCQMNIIPCHRLWGCPLSSLQNTKRRSNETLMGENRVEELVAAFVLRVNTN